MKLNTEQSGLLQVLLANLHPKYMDEAIAFELTDDLKMVIDYFDEAIDFLDENELEYKVRTDNKIEVQL
jgi:hypothetical protein